MKYVFTALLFLSIPAYAQTTLHLATKDGSVSLDQARYPASMKTGIEVINSKCKVCHSESRLIHALETKETEAGLPFTKAEIRGFFVKKMRRPDANLNKQEVEEVIKVVGYILEDSQ